MSSKVQEFKKGQHIRLKASGAVYELLESPDKHAQALGLYLGGGRGHVYADSSSLGTYVPFETKVTLSSLCSLSGAEFWESAEDPFVDFVRATLAEAET